MIIIGYPGIGKSSLAQNRLDIIDLESCWTRIEGRKGLNWEEIYIQMAEGLSQQGYIVMVSAHYNVQNRLKKSSETVVAVFPGEHLVNLWTSRLQKRYHDTGSAKDKRAYLDACLHFEDEISHLREFWGSNVYAIDSMNYDLAEIVEKLVLRYDRGCRNGADEQRLDD